MRAVAGVDGKCCWFFVVGGIWRFSPNGAVAQPVLYPDPRGLVEEMGWVESTFLPLWDSQRSLSLSARPAGLIAGLMNHCGTAVGHRAKNPTCQNKDA